MRKTFLIVAQALLILVACANNNSTTIAKHRTETEMEKTNQNPVYEIAVFKVKDANAVVEANQAAIRHISTYDGYISSRTFQSIEDSDIFMDIVEWSSLEAAKRAQQDFEKSKNEDVANYLSLITEIIYFGHVSEVEEGVLKFNELAKDDILEFAMIQINSKDSKEYEKAHIDVLNHIGKKYDSFKEVQTVQSLDKVSQFIDLARWGSAEQCYLAQKEMEKDPVFLDFASHIDMSKEMIMQFFVQIR